MGWRVVCIDNAIKLNYKLNSLGVLQNEEVVWICLDEIDTIIVESMICNTSFRLLMELCKKGIGLIICGENHMPIGSLNSLIDNQRTAKYNRIQLRWKIETKKELWTKIIKQKILLQSIVLRKNGKIEKSDMLIKYYNDVLIGDVTNREGHAAKVYFNALFGKDFVRKREADDIINASLNYIYQIVRSKIAQEIISHGYIPSLGIFHCSEYNYFGLADDIIEIYRPIVDYFVNKLIMEEDVKFMTSLYKEKLLNILYNVINYNNAKHKLIDTIKIVVLNITDSLSNSNVDNITFPMFYE